MDKLVSIIVCVYNGERYIEQCIESIYAQTYKNIEVIVINDGSTDRTEQILCKYKGIKYYYQSNMGIGSARSRGLKYCTGEYIAWLDADDIYLENKIEEQVKCLESTGADIVYGNVYLIDKDNKILKEIKNEYGILSRQNLLAYMLFRNIIPCFPEVMYRRSCFEGINYTKGMRCDEDYEMFIKLLQKCRIIFMDKGLYLYRRHDKNLTLNQEEQKKTEKKIIKDIGEEGIKKIIWESDLSTVEKRLLLGKVLFKIEEYKKVIDVLSQINEPNIGFYKNLYIANSYYKIEDYRKAKLHYQEAIEVDISKAEALNNLGVVERKLGNETEARSLFEKALQINKDYMDAKYNLLNGNGMKMTERELRRDLILYALND